MTLILASGSASRRAILTGAGVPFTAIPADIDEDALKEGLLRDGTPLPDVALHLAEAKARSVSRTHPADLVLGADQTLILNDTLVSKCADLGAARALLKMLRGKPHGLVGGTVLMRGGDVVWRHVSVARLVMRDFSDGFLDVYLAAEGAGILSSVGCYKLEGLGAQLFESVEGDYFSILGLALQPLLAALRGLGVLRA